MIEHALMFGSCLVILFTAAVFLLSHKFEEGAFGHAGLALMVLACIVVVSEIVWGHVDYSVLPETLLLHVGVALFMIRLAWEHLRYCRKGRRRDETTECRLPSGPEVTRVR